MFILVHTNEGEIMLNADFIKHIRPATSDYDKKNGLRTEIQFYNHPISVKETFEEVAEVLLEPEPICSACGGSGKVPVIDPTGFTSAEGEQTCAQCRGLGRYRA